MRPLLKRRLFRSRKKAEVIVLPGLKKENESTVALKAIGWSSVAVGVVALGLYVGRELRQRYKFNRRTPYDVYSHAGDQMQSDAYGMGI
ncbi:hypothetical protein H7849_18200 [Alloacidobacterium dinghuense]|uniref:Uncharacterized protein n=1 Tax=Alloacidobacterium dinghuense TaxID=2763107 RepID=A0A7G8BEQ3_9BACT|nr:hypothetical protein H7849_18200 [Alloacidobacterium dinghuense]